MALTDPWPVNSGMTDAKEIRLGLTAVFNTHGVVPGSKPADNAAMPSLVYASSTMVPSVRDFTVVVSRPSTVVPTDGFSVMRNVGSTGIPAVPTAPTTGSQLHTMVVRVNDSGLGDGKTTPEFLYRSGVATTGTPQPGLLLDGDEEICQILIPAGATGLNSTGVVITHTYQSATTVGAIRYARTQAQRDAWTDVEDGTQCFTVSAGQLHEYRALSGMWHRLDADTFVVVTATGARSQGQTLGTLGGENVKYETSDPNFFPSRSDGVVGPIALAGWYEVQGAVDWALNSTGDRQLTITQNDVDLSPTIGNRIPANGITSTTCSGMMKLNAGDYVKLKGWQSSAGGLAYSSRLTVRLVRFS